MAWLRTLLIVVFALRAMTLAFGRGSPARPGEAVVLAFACWLLAFDGVEKGEL